MKKTVITTNRYGVSWIEGDDVAGSPILIEASLTPENDDLLPRHIGALTTALAHMVCSDRDDQIELTKALGRVLRGYSP